MLWLYNTRLHGICIMQWKLAWNEKCLWQDSGIALCPVNLRTQACIALTWCTAGKLMQNSHKPRRVCSSSSSSLFFFMGFGFRFGACKLCEMLKIAAGKLRRVASCTVWYSRTQLYWTRLHWIVLFVQLFPVFPSRYMTPFTAVVLLCSEKHAKMRVWSEQWICSMIKKAMGHVIM